MNQVIKNVEKFKPLRSHSIRDFSDRISILSVVFLLVAAFIISNKTYYRNPLQCYTAIHPKSKNFNKFNKAYIWTHGTIPKSSISNKFPETKQQWITLYDEFGIHHYQWIPFLLILLAILIYIPILVWDTCCKSAVRIDLVTLINEARRALYFKDEFKQKCVEQISMSIRLILSNKERKTGLITRIRKKITNFILAHTFSLSGKNFLFSTYIGLKLLSIISCLSQLVMLHFVFNINLVSIIDLIRGQPNDISTAFPIDTYGLISDLRLLGSENFYYSECRLTVNMYNEKLFVLIWFGLVMLVMFHVVSILVWLNRILMTHKRLRIVKKLFRVKGVDIPDRNNLNKFVSDFLKIDGIFVINMLSRNTGDLITSDVVHDLWTNYCSELSIY